MMQNYLLELGGRVAGRLFSASGGNLRTEEVVSKIGRGRQVSSSIGTAEYGDIVVEFGVGMSQDFYNWISDSFRQGYQRRSGAVIALDHQWKPSSRREFMDALITSIALPELDRSSSKQAVMTVSIKPERVAYRKPDADVSAGVHALPHSKAWTANSFRLEIPGLEAECARVNRIGPLTARTKTKTTRVGANRLASLVPTGSDHSSLVLSVPQASTEGFQKWFDDAVMKGNISAAAEKDGSLEFYAPNSRNVYFTVHFHGLGIVGMKSSGPKGSNLPVKVELSCQDMTFSAGAAAIK